MSVTKNTRRPKCFVCKQTQKELLNHPILRGKKLCRPCHKALRDDE